jgi:hypothetical protein
MAHDVFVSYSSIDKPVADAACTALEQRGIRCWIAPRDILPGLDWGAAIVDAISESRIMVLVFSSNANRSPQIKREVERAVSKGVTIVPLRIEDVPLGKTLEYFISTAHWFDAFPAPIQGHMARLAGTIQILLSRPQRVSATGVPISRPSALESAPLPAETQERRVDPRSRRLALAAVGALALVLVVGWNLLRPSPPEIVSVRYPPLVTAGVPGTGTIEFADRRGEVALAQFEVVQAAQFSPFSFAPPVAGRKSGSFSFPIWSPVAQHVTLQAVLVNKAGRRSRPYPFSFEVQEARKSSPGRRPPARSFTIQAPNGFRFKIPR